jgi:site-specific DNA-methyltransferase (adenine-specific)
MLEINQVHCGDCLCLLPSIPDKSIDLILCDLPYGTTNCQWDSPIDLSKLWVEYKRVIKDRCPVILFAQTPFDKVLGCSNLEWLKYEWIWEKTQATGFFNAKKMPMKAHENLLVFYDKTPIYNPQKTQGHSPVHTYTKKAEICNQTEVYGKVKVNVSGGGDTDRYPRSVVIFSSDKQKNKLDGTLHPTQKPLALCEYMIRTYTNEGALVLDNCAGSGTIGLAAKNTNRDFILIEKEEKYCELSKRRIFGEPQ